MSIKSYFQEEDFPEVSPEDRISLAEAMRASIENCSMCGTELEFTHAANFETFMIKERSKCPCCGIQSQEKEHRIQ